MAAGEQIVSRIFGLTPYSRGTVLPVEIFRKFSSIVNLMIRYGIRLDNSEFKYDQLISVKRFYDKVRNLPDFSKKTKSIGLRERANRCAAQFSYFSIREHKIRASFISACSLIISDASFSCLFGEQFPNNDLLEKLKSKIKDLGYSNQYLSRVYLENVLKHTRNLLKQKLTVKLGKPIKTYLNDKYKITELSSHLTEELHLNLQVYVAEFCDRLKRVISNRIKNLHKEIGFFSQIQGRIMSIAARNNIKTESVKARGTSQRCSHCGEAGNRKGKQFVCNRCGFSCDSDLNAARNITTAQLSYGAISVIGG